MSNIRIYSIYKHNNNMKREKILYYIKPSHALSITRIYSSIYKHNNNYVKHNIKFHI